MSNAPEQISANKYRRRTITKAFPSHSGANSVTDSIVKYLRLNGHTVNRTNNHATFDIKRAAGVVSVMIGARQVLPIGGIIARLRKCYNKGTATKGAVLDITGFTKKEGRYLAIEVKVGKDSLSKEQKETITAINNNGGIGLVVTSFDDFENKWEDLATKKHK